jgi:serine/threonine-protein kinase
VSYDGVEVLNYRLGERIGEGGFGVVHRAVHTTLGRRAAVKILHAEFARHREVVERFLREARVVCQIEHPAIVEIQNSGRLPTGEPFYIMELVDGESLAAVVAATGPLSAETAIAVFGRVAEALEAAHAQRVVHRDLKPSNVMLERRDGRIEGMKLLDFGIAKLLDAGDTVESSTGRMLGTPAYMAPEQARDAKMVDERADIYSFAATLFDALAGRAPFQGGSLAELIVAVQTRPAPSLRSVRPRTPERLDAAVARCLAKDPGGRPATIRDAWGEIRAGLEEAVLLPTLVAEPGLLAQPASRGQAAALAPTVTEAAAAAGEPRRRRWLVPAAVVALACGAGAAVWATSSGEGRDWTFMGPVAVRVPAAPIDADPAARAPGSAATPPPSDTAAPRAAAGDGVVTGADASQPVASVGVDVAAPDGPPATAATPRGARRGRRRPTPQAPAAPAADLDCAKASFERVYDAPAPTSREVGAALDRLKRCRAAGRVDETRYRQIQTALVKKL